MASMVSLQTLFSVVVSTGRDIHLELLESLASGLVSCRGEVLSLLSKIGDWVQLRNWGLVALLWLDKNLSRALSNSMEGVLQNIVDTDQSYCIPERSMMDNIFLETFLIFVKYCHINMGIVSPEEAA